MTRESRHATQNYTTYSVIVSATHFQDTCGFADEETKNKSMSSVQCFLLSQIWTVWGKTEGPRGREDYSPYSLRCRHRRMMFWFLVFIVCAAPVALEVRRARQRLSSTGSTHKMYGCFYIHE